ncbi:MAG: flippase, partial [Lachnospiraceae bacterium]|nr:flippase [Lachnospiraceae bacterium]
YLIYNVLNVFFPFLTGIYVSHVLLPDTIGRVNAAQNLVQYFVIFAFLGIPTYGLREISKARNLEKEKNRLFSELYIINLISTLIFSSLYLGVIFIVPQYKSDLILYMVVGILIVLNAFNISWLYEGLEEFRFISIRNLIFKAISFIFLILFVKDEKDFLLFALVNVIGTAGNYIINMIYSPGFVRFTFENLNLKRHMKSIMYLVSVNLAIELYSLVDITMMNFVCEKDEIAFYKYGQSIERILLQIINTFTMVLVPRISFYYKEKKIDGFNNLLSKALRLIVLFSFPMIIGIFFTSDLLLVKLYGEPYISSAMILKLLSVLIFISPVGYLLGSRVMLATGNESRMIIPVGLGAIVNIIGNAFMIPLWGGRGASIASVLSEIVVMIIYVSMGKKYFKINNLSGTLYKTAISILLMTGFLFASSYLMINAWILLTIQILGSMLIYGGLLIALREEIIMEYFKAFIRRLNPKR